MFEEGRRVHENEIKNLHCRPTSTIHPKPKPKYNPESLRTPLWTSICWNTEVSRNFMKFYHEISWDEISWNLFILFFCPRRFLLATAPKDNQGTNPEPMVSDISSESSKPFQDTRPTFSNPPVSPMRYHYVYFYGNFLNKLGSVLKNMNISWGRLSVEQPILYFVFFI